MALSEQEKEGWGKYQQDLHKRLSKSEDLFEKTISFIASGALALTITFHNSIVSSAKPTCIIFIGIGWSLLISTLFLNLLSHYNSAKSIRKSIGEVDDIIDGKMTFNDLVANVTKRNKVISYMNVICIILLGVGLLSIMTYVLMNIQNG